MHSTKSYISFTWNINIHKDMGMLSTKLHKKPKLSWGNTNPVALPAMVLHSLSWPLTTDM